MHQYQRPTKQFPGASDSSQQTRYIEVTLDDIALANELVPEVLGRSLDELPPQSRRLLGHIRELMKALARSKTVRTFTRKELREHCGWSLTQVRVHLERLVELEYLAVRHGRLGSLFVYEILFDLDAPETIAHIGLIEVEKLRHYMAGGAATLTGLEVGLADPNGRLAGDGQTLPPPLPLNDSAVNTQT